MIDTKPLELKHDDTVRAAEERHQPISSNARRGYVTGIGWCWLYEGEVIEVIQEEGEDDYL